MTAAFLIRECDEKGIAWGVQIDNSDTRLVPDERFFKETRDGYLKNRVVPGLDPDKLEKIYKAYIVCPEPEEQQLEALKKLPWCRYMPEYFFAMLLIISIISTVLPTPAPPNNPILPPFM